jgi:tRNA 2-selenouridine synthase
MEVGYEYVKPKLASFLEQSRKLAQDGPLIIHCWRGGMRSRAFAQHLLKNGFNDVSILSGGYKAYRNYVQSFFNQDLKLRILGGFTGSGKTYILKELKAMGEQVIDLEGLANHKSSAFGAIGERPQPSIEHFENKLFHELSKLDLQKAIWVEDESRKIGHVSIPLHIYELIREQVVYFVDIPKEKRARFLVGEYSFSGNELIEKAINGIAKRLGGLNVKKAQEYLVENNYYEVAMLALQYYDKAYSRGIGKRDPDKVVRLELLETNHKSNAKKLLKIL